MSFYAIKWVRAKCHLRGKRIECAVRHSAMLKYAHVECFSALKRGQVYGCEEHRVGVAGRTVIPPAGSLYREGWPEASGPGAAADCRSGRSRRVLGGSRPQGTGLAGAVHSDAR